jgi:hypothetical protein
MFPKRLRGEILLLLCAKVAALTAIYFLLVAPATRPEPDGAALRAHLIESR